MTAGPPVAAGPPMAAGPPVAAGPPATARRLAVSSVPAAPPGLDPDLVCRLSRPRRAVDVLVAGLALALALPVLAALAVVLVVTDPGPVIYRQVRVGRGGRPFTILKLRTMRAGSSGSDLTADGDPRVTRFGGLLRRTSLDELPQLVNILVGSMSLVGPRPETPDLARRYPDSCRWVFAHTPGLTGPAQVTLRDEPMPRAGDPEAWYLEQLVPRRVARDAVFLEDPSVRHTIAWLGRTAAHVTRRGVG